MIILIRFISNADTTHWIGQALMILFTAIADSQLNDEEKILPCDLIGRLARIPIGNFVYFTLLKENFIRNI